MRIKVFRVRAYTLLELLVVIGIIGVLTALVALNYGRIMNMAGQVRCMGNLRGLHSVFSTYVTDYESWPQQPDFNSEADDEYEAWWINTMQPFGVTEKMWQCATLSKMERQSPKNERSRIHYTPTQFGPEALAARKWQHMPWFTEIANAHGKGALIIFTDGSIRASDEFMQ